MRQDGRIAGVVRTTSSGSQFAIAKRVPGGALSAIDAIPIAFVVARTTDNVIATDDFAQRGESVAHGMRLRERPRVRAATPRARRNAPASGMS